LPCIEEFFGEPFDLVLGHRRLAIIDLSPAGHQPMASSDGRYWIVYNGEVYNYLELRSELESYGYTFRTNTDTEVILVAYQQWGIECLSRFNGMWAFALWDGHEQRLFLARDRFGVKPLYYVHEGGKFAFASEIKALVGRHGRPFEPEDGVIYRYLVGGLLPSPQAGETFFKGVQSLPPGHWLVVRPDGVVAKQRYWTLPINPTGESSRDAAVVIGSYRELFIDAVRLRLRADVPVGTCLSGGVDSSSIVCVVNRLMAEGGLTAEQIGRQQKTFSAVYDTAGPYNERVYIEKVLQATGAEGNFTFPTAERLRDSIERLIWYQDEPFPSTSIFAQWCVMSKVRERGVTVLLDGQGADETLGGYRPFGVILADLIRQMKLGRALSEIRAIHARTDVSVWPFLVRALVYQLPESWIQFLLRQRALLNASVLQPDFAATWRTTEWPLPEGLRDLDSHLRFQVQESSLPHLLRYEDRNSMAFSIEARLPFLDYRLVQFAFGEASRWRIRQGWTKWILREAMRGIVPDEILWRKDKVAFETPEEEWIRQWLRNQPNFFSDDILSRDYLNPRAIRKELASWIATRGNARPIWRWINLEIWLRVWSMA
jgi:asparagine synthase (glutamine-hydrolysing)